MKSFIYYYCIAFATLVSFLYGFFPIQQNKVTDPLRPPTFLNDHEFNVSQLYKQEVDRIIVVVIDALRTDFIKEANMPFLVSTYTKQGCMLSVHVQSPTVTLPRIKALTTGNIPQFIDVILNLASTEALGDSLLHRMKEAGKKIVFYGDETWIKLYPSVFERYEGVSSFYVNDFTEVDDNVTRNVVGELTKNDWDAMFLHYLGLDHIGHVFGPSSHLIQPKLKEMDKIIENIYLSSKLWNKRTLIAVTGDHGMKDSGGHGGSTAGETQVPFVSIGIPCKTDTVAQTDIPPTLSVLMGLTLPTSSVGRVIVNMLVTYSFDRLLYVLHYGAMALYARTKEYESLFEDASLFHYKYFQTGDEIDANVARKFYDHYLSQTSDHLVHSSVKQDVHSLFVASVLLLYCFCAVSYNLIQSNAKEKCKTEKIEPLFIIAILLFQLVLPQMLLLTALYLFIIIIFVLRNLRLILKVVVTWKLDCDIRTFVIIWTVVHSLSLLSSSFIEEEHQVWYFFWCSFAIISYILVLHETNMFQLLLLAVGLRLLRTLNQTGDKWAHLPDVSQWLLLEENYLYLQVLFCVSLILIWVSCFVLCGKQRKTLFLSAIVLVLIYIFRTYAMHSSLLGKLIWCLIFANLCLGLAQSSQYLEHVITAWILICALVMRSYNVILLPACVCSSLMTNKCIKRVDTSTVVHIWLGKALFFLQGHSNSLASIDIASGYVGLQEYLPSVVIMQVLCHTYTFPVLANLLMLKRYLLRADIIWNINVVSQLLVVVTTCVIILIQRHHLFVWSVFAPKLLIESCHSAVLLAEILIFYFVTFVRNIVVEYKNKTRSLY